MKVIDYLGKIADGNLIIEENKTQSNDEVGLLHNALNNFRYNIAEKA